MEQKELPRKKCKADTRNQIVLVLDGKRVPGAQRLFFGPVVMDKLVLFQLHSYQTVEHERILEEFLDVQRQSRKERFELPARLTSRSRSVQHIRKQTFQRLRHPIHIQGIHNFAYVCFRRAVVPNQRRSCAAGSRSHHSGCL